jgi:hypothetical protein
MELDIRLAGSAASTVEDAARRISNSLECGWNDPVHESFYIFVDDFSSINTELAKICDDIRTVSVQVKNVDATRLQNTLNALLHEMPR